MDATRISSEVQGGGRRVFVGQTSPLAQMREQLGLSRRELAVAAGISWHVLYQCETGYRQSIPRRVLQALDRMGIDPEQILESQEAFWEAKARDIVEQHSTRGE